MHLHSVVRGSGAGLHAEPMPGTLRLARDGVHWVAEGTDAPVSLCGAVRRPDGERPRLRSGPDEPIPVPRELVWGLIEAPETIQIALAAGGCAELTVRARSAEHVRAVLTSSCVESLPLDLERLRRRPLTRFTILFVGLQLLMLDPALALWSAADACASADPHQWSGGLFGTAGGVTVVAGLWLIQKRANLVRRGLASRNRTPTPDPAGRDELAGANGHGDLPDRAPGRPTVVSEAVRAGDPFEPGLTFVPVRGALARRCADEDWLAAPADNPRDWCAARTRLGVRRASQLRQLAGAAPHTTARYLLARDWAGFDIMILFPAGGDVPPIGVIDLMRPCAGAIPIAGTVSLVGSHDPRTRRPAEGAWIVPVLCALPLWPGDVLRVLDAKDLQGLVMGTAEDDGEDGGEGGVPGDRPLETQAVGQGRAALSEPG